MFSRRIITSGFPMKLRTITPAPSPAKLTPLSLLSFKSNNGINPINTIQQTRSYAWSNKREEAPKVRYFFLVAIIGSAIFALVIKKVDQQDPVKSLAKRKNSMSEEEWEDQLVQLRRKALTFKSDEFDFFFVPVGANRDDKKVNELVDKLGGDETVGVVDLNELIEQQLSVENSKFGILLNDTLETKDLKSNDCHYKFSYRLAPGVFTKLMKDTLISLQKENPKLTRFILLNYPNTIQEAVKFEQDVAISKRLVLLGDGKEQSDIVDYFDTVDKVVKLKDIKKGEFELLAAKPKKASASEEPGEDAPAIKKAQYKLRQLGEPVRRYGETDQDVIDRLSVILKNN